MTLVADGVVDGGKRVRISPFLHGRRKFSGGRLCACTIAAATTTEERRRCHNTSSIFRVRPFVIYPPPSSLRSFRDESFVGRILLPVLVLADIRRFSFFPIRCRIPPIFMSFRIFFFTI